MTQCKVCHEAASKYKCPTCLIKYCSVPCYKKHKESPDCVKPQLPTDQKPSENQVQVLFETEDTVRPEKLNLLGYDKNILQDLKNGHLRKLLEEVNSSQNPYDSIKEAMNDEQFLEFVTHCLKIVEQKHQ